MTEQRTAYLHSSTLDNSQAYNSRAYMGSVLTIPVSGESSRGRFAVIEVEARPGNEPPPHIHGKTNSSTSSRVARCSTGRERFATGAGDDVLIPAGVAHATRLAAEHGCRFLSPDETRERLPGYPGCGAYGG